MIADRFLLQQSWWLASELVRRHPSMWVDRFDHPGSGPVLVAFEPDSAARVFFDLRHGVRAMRGDTEAHWSWEHVFSSPGAHDMVKRIEAAIDRPLRGRAPATTGRSIVYRLIARLSAAHVDAARPWLPVPIAVEPMVQGRAESTDEPLIAGFDTVHDDILRYRKKALADFDDPSAIGMRPYLWAMTRDLETAFVLDADGYVHDRGRGAAALLPLYAQHGRDLDRLLVKVLEDTAAVRR